jgi:hypothetical protein
MWANFFASSVKPLRTQWLKKTQKKLKSESVKPIDFFAFSVKPLRPWWLKKSQKKATLSNG